MKRLVLVVAVAAVAVCAATFALLSRSAPATLPPARPAPESARQTRPVEPESDAELLRRLKQGPNPITAEAAKAMAYNRVFSEDIPGGASFRGVDYKAAVTPAGLDYVTKVGTFSLRPLLIERGAASGPFSPGKVKRTAEQIAQIDRDGIVEEFVFENDRVEQLFRIPAFPGDGELRIRMAMETSFVDRRLVAIPRHKQGWKDSTMWNGGISIQDQKGRQMAAYHTAKVIDAKGRELSIDPSVEDGLIVLAVPDTFMATAAFPIVVDPWLELDASAQGGGITNNSRVSEGISVALDGSGHPWVTWSDDSAGNFDIYVRFWNGFAWKDVGGSTAPGGISQNPGKSSHPYICLGTQLLGSTFVVWDDESSGDYEIYLREWTGSAWEDRGGSSSGHGLSSSLGQSLYPTVSVTLVRREIIAAPDVIEIAPIVAWQEDVGGASEIFVRIFFKGDSDSTAGWYGVGGTNVSNTVGRVSDRPRIFMDNFGRPMVTWADTINGNYEIFLRGYFDDGALPMAPFSAGMVFTVDSGITISGSNVGIGIVGYVDNSTGNPITGIPDFGTWQPIAGSGTGGGISATAGMSLYPYPAIDHRTGDIYVCWQESPGAAPSPTEIFVRRTLALASPPQPANFTAWTPLGVAATVNASSTGRAVFPVMGLQSSTPTSAAVPFVVWQDDTVGNPEIFVRQFLAGAWTEVGDNGSSTGTTPPNRGISNSDNLSFVPAIGNDQLGQPVVAWLDGALGAFDVFVRKFYVVRSITLSQADSVGPILVGGTTPDTTIFLTGNVTAETLAVPTATGVRLQVEVRPVGTPFIGTATLESALVGPGGAVPPGTGTPVTIPFNGAPNVRYAWRARAVDLIGRASPWESFGTNADTVSDFEVRQLIPTPPPTGLDQRRADQTTVIPIGTTIPDSTVVIVGTVTPPDASTPVRLEVEVVPTASAFSGTATAQSALVTVPTQFLLSHAALNDGSYHWRARTITQGGAASGWVSFGGNLDGQADFAIAAPLPANLDQRRLDGILTIPLGAISEENGVVFVGDIASPSTGLTVRLDVEFTTTVNGFTGNPTVSSALVNGGPVSITANGIPFGSYHWRARTRTSANTATAWVSFGANLDGQTDFQLFVAPPPATAANRRSCGLTGLEAVVLLGAVALIRRRRSKK